MSADNHSKGDIMIVDDMPTNVDLLAALLERRGYTVRAAMDGPTALSDAKASPPDLILLDINMPEMNGYQVCEELKAYDATRDVPVIFLSALGETIDKVEAFKVGGVDYITKPFQMEEVVARIQGQLTLYRQRQELERQRREIEELREKERLYFDEMNRIKDEFVRTVSHDLKNPIAVIVGYVEVLRDSGLVHGEEAMDYLQRIQRGAEHMNALVLDLLDLARLEAGMALEVQELGVSELIQISMANNMFIAEQKDIKLSAQIPEPEITISGDYLRLEQALNNLLSNAIKYTPVGGEVEISGYAERDEAVIAVKDTGYGIPPDDLEKLFKKFFRVNRKEHNESDGTGLGLSIVKAIADQHQGRIWVESELGAGSTFSLALPIS